MKRDELPAPELLRAPPPTPRHSVERLVTVQRRAPTLVHFTTTRPADYRFTPGHYARLGLGADDDLVWRPYSIASAAGDERLAFQLTCAPEGRFTALFCGLAAGAPIRVDARSFGFLTLDTLAPGGTVWMLSTGTGVAPFLAIIADPRTWQRHQRVVLVHSVRHAGELVTDAIDAAMARLPAERARLTVVTIVTRERVPGALDARIGALLRDGGLERAGGGFIDPAQARVMLCGNPEMIKDARHWARERGLEPGRRGIPGQLATEGYW